MRSPASSFPAERPGPWYRETWPWLLAAGPLLVVVASLLSAWLAVASDDGVVAEDYYKRGLLINQELRRATAGARPALGAVIRTDGSGEVHVRLEGLAASPQTLHLKLVHPTRSADDQVVALQRIVEQEYVGHLASPGGGRWIVVLESDAWRLPTTTVYGPWREIRLGAARAAD